MNQLLKNKTICFIGAHPDDIELGCGGFIVALNNRNKAICLTLTTNQKNPLLKNLIHEHYKSLTSLGISKENTILADFTARNFLQERQKICDYFVEVNKQYQPDVVFAHALSDFHQDHEVVVKEAIRVFNRCTIITYEAVCSNLGFSPNYYCELTTNQVDKKIQALGCYLTYKDKSYFSPDLLRAQLIKNGAVIGKKYAEGYNILRLIDINEKNNIK